MFICDPCLKENFNNQAMFQSHGRCELCKESKPCYDIPSKYLKPIPKEKVDISKWF